MTKQSMINCAVGRVYSDGEIICKEDDDFRIQANRERQIDKLQKQADHIEKWFTQNYTKISSNGKTRIGKHVGTFNFVIGQTIPIMNQQHERCLIEWVGVIPLVRLTVDLISYKSTGGTERKC